MSTTTMKTRKPGSIDFPQTVEHKGITLHFSHKLGRIEAVYRTAELRDLPSDWIEQREVLRRIHLAFADNRAHESVALSAANAALRVVLRHEERGEAYLWAPRIEQSPWTCLHLGYVSPERAEQVLQVAREAVAVLERFEVEQVTA